MATSLELLKNYKHDEDPKDFSKYVSEASKVSLLMLPEVKAQNGPRTAPILYKLTIVCTHCHDDFR